MRKRCDLHGRHTVSLLTCHDELVEAHGKINSIKSLCVGSVLKYGVGGLKQGLRFEKARLE